MLKEVNSEKERQDKAEVYKRIYLEKLNEYGVTDASQLTDEQLHEFLEGMKTYKNRINQKS
jgi:hypothetical protein